MATRAVICSVCSDLVDPEREGEHLAAHLKAMHARPSNGKKLVFEALAWLVLVGFLVGFASVVVLLVRLAMRT